MKTKPDMRFEIRRAANGIILKAARPSLPDDEGTELVWQELYEEGVECFADFLRTLADEFGPATGRYSPKRIYITVAPGDKFQDLTSSE